MAYCSRCGGEVHERDLFCTACGQETRRPDPPATPAPPTSPIGDDLASRYPPPPATPDSGLNHLFRFIGVQLSVGLASLALVGIAWQAHIQHRTGYRRRDLLWQFVPIAGAVVQTKTIWRYTARNVYWTPREDRPSGLLGGWQRPWAIAIGWVVVPLAVAVAVVVSLSFGWSDAEREELIERYERQGMSRAVAECIADQYIDEIPDAAEAFYSVEELEDAENDAIALCNPDDGP